MILLIDNYDSFVHNLARYFRRLGAVTQVVRNDAIDVAAIRQLRPQAIVLSPGPCTPTEAGCSLAVVRELGGEVPLLGVCLGHQAIGSALGGSVIRASQPMHGRTSEIRHSQRQLFENLPSPLTVGRYHSLVIDPQSLPAELEVTATTADGTIMAVAHRRLPMWGVQFHPESILTEGGYTLLANFLRLAGIEPTAPLPQTAEERPIEPDDYVVPSRPVTF
ncbi:anthranilate synthase component II [Anatilimnocola floriformis]|uniref:anthranilate synthase component II n=1 Tax=Anatilimnocola floriformis TaxID=2948575 RepID=UPI0020C2F2A8|nr:aminodeoxychorismate/anthranilate synthase component II [Anatilimnocola floriformis]